MADPKHLQFLLDCTERPAGRKEWVEYKLRIAWIDLSTADFTERRLANYDLSEVNLSAAIFLGADLSGADLSDATLSYTDLRRAALRNAALDRADLSGANLQGADLTDACLEHAAMPRAKLVDALLVGVDLSNADLSGADLRGASLKYARLAGAKLEGANVANADLTGIVMDDSAPAVLVKFADAVVDDRKYREMRSRLASAAPGAAAAGGVGAAGLGSRDLAVAGKNGGEGKAGAGAGKSPKGGMGTSAASAGAAGAGPAEDAAGRKQKKKKSAAEALRPQPKADLGPVRYEQGIPIREREPDLTSTDVCCRILEIPLTATTEEVAKAFRTKAKLYHPDKVRNLPERLQALAADEFQRVFKAYEMLTRRTTRPLVGIKWAAGVPYKDSAYEYTVEEYEKLAAVNPGNTSILYNLAWKYFEASQYQEAIQGFQRVLDIDPKDDDASYNFMIVRLFVELQLPSPL